MDHYRICSLSISVSMSPDVAGYVAFHTIPGGPVAFFGQITLIKSSPTNSSRKNGVFDVFCRPHKVGNHVCRCFFCRLTRKLIQLSREAIIWSCVICSSVDVRRVWGGVWYDAGQPELSILDAWHDYARSLDDHIAI